MQIVFEVGSHINSEPLITNKVVINPTKWIITTLIRVPLQLPHGKPPPQLHEVYARTRGKVQGVVGEETGIYRVRHKSLNDF